MSASKKQVTELENAVIILEERIEKMEEEHTLLKQMLTMQSTLIENLQMMMKMMSVSVPSQQYKVFQYGGDGGVEDKLTQSEHSPQNMVMEGGHVSTENNKVTNPSINKMKFRMSRVTS